jgi:hypothetical protein
MSDLDEVSLVLSPTERYLNPRQLQDYLGEGSGTGIGGENSRLLLGLIPNDKG